MKKNLLISSILGGISLVCALLIASFNMITSGIIEENTKKTELATCQAIYTDYDADKSEEVSVESDVIVKKVLAKDTNGNELGYLYTVTGKNSYGAITLMVAIKDNKVLQVEFLENGQSYASTVVSHLKENYPSSKDEVIYPFIKPEATPEVGALDSTQVEGIDTKCGATFGANLVKELINVALDDAKGGN